MLTPVLFDREHSGAVGTPPHLAAAGECGRDYRCRGRLLPSPQRFVRRHLYRKGQRFRLDERDAPWFRLEVNESNRYGVPRFDIVNDGFLP